jgi:capsule polysaccharide export protein KpsE/RkpR
MICANVPKSAERPPDTHDEFLAAVDLYNREAVFIVRLIEEIRPESEAFFQAGEKLQSVLDAGIENLSPEDLQRFHARLAQMKQWMARFKPKYSALQARVAAQEKQESQLKRQAKQLGVAIDFHSPIAN